LFSSFLTFLINGEKNMTKWVLISIVSLFMLMTGIWIIDVTVSGIITVGINNFHLESLVLESISPRVSYHIGLLLVLISWFTLFVLIWYEKNGGEKSDRESNKS